MEVFRLQLPIPASLTWRLTEFEKRELEYAIADRGDKAFDEGLKYLRLDTSSLPRLGPVDAKRMQRHIANLQAGRDQNAHVVRKFLDFMSPPGAGSDAAAP